MAANILEHAENWEASYTPGFFYKFYCFLSRFLSHKTLSFYCILWKQGVTKTGSGSPFAKYLHFEDFQYYRR